MFKCFSTPVMNYEVFVSFNVGVARDLRQLWSWMRLSYLSHEKFKWVIIIGVNALLFS